MANPIPPLLCSTPPPIDFDEESSANNDTIDELCEFDAGDTETFDGQSLPSTPSHLTHIINKKVVDSLSVTKDNINISDERENIENIHCEDKTESMSKVIETETQSAILSLELDVNKVIETYKSEVVTVPINECLNNFEENSDIEKSVKLSNNLSECDLDCVFANDEKHVQKNIDSRFNDKNELLLKDDEHGRSLEGDVKTNIQGFSIIKTNELESASKNETLNSSIEDISDIKESNSDNIKSDTKHINAEDLSLITKGIENVSKTIIENDIDTVISNEFSAPYIENNSSDKTNVDEDVSNFTFEADFSQFQSFESFKPINIDQINRRPSIDNIKMEGLKQDENSKEPFDDGEDEFENFQNYSSSQSANLSDKDDSNEFTDFKEATISPALSEISTTSQANLKTILDTMFPLSHSDNSTNMDINIEIEKLNQCRQKKSIILNPVDSATALNFQWSDSTIKHSLVKSIGIDSRNILHGEKWNSSMPRFAANLSFNPLEPLKPVKLDSTANTTFFLENEPSTSLGKSVTNRSDVPAVEFDWNTSGLVNPLDGIKEVMDERKNETLYTKQSVELQDTTQELSKTENDIINNLKCSESSNSNDKKSIGKIPEDEQSMHTKEYLATTFDTNLIIEQSPQEPCTLTKNNNNLESNKNLEHLIYTNYQNCENIDIISTSSSTNANTFIVPLKETHIFTPSKSDAAVSRSTINISETTSDNGKCCIPVDFDYEIAAAGTVIDETVIKKEYRDIEYNPNKFILVTLDTNSIQLNNENPNSLKVLEKSEIIAEPFTNELSVTTNGDWEFYNNNANKEIFDNKFMNKNNDTNLTQELSINTNDEGISNFQYDVSEEKFNNFLKPTIGLSPTENLTIPNEFNRENKVFENDQVKKDSSNVDDEFTDFQFVPPTSSTLVTNSFTTRTTNALDIKNPRTIANHSIDKINRTNTIPDQMILSPAILLPQLLQINNCEPKIEWPEPGIDPEELSRIETLFPSSTKHSDFYNQGSSALNHHSSTNSTSKNTTSINNDEDWSDFISVPAVNTSENNLNTIYCPKSPTKVAKSIITTTTTTAEFNNDDEWSDFISSIPSSTNIMNTSSGQFNKNTNGTLKKNSLYNNSYYPSSSITINNTSQQKHKNNIPNQTTVNNSNCGDQTIINNKICQYLLNNGNIESKETTMNLNTLKTTDYLSHPLYQQQQHNINQQIINSDQLNHHKTAPSISLIPDLGYVAPQNLISIPKLNLQKK